MEIKNKKCGLIEGIEMGLNFLAQNLVFRSHTEKDLEDYINQFKFIDDNWKKTSNKFETTINIEIKRKDKL
jgi:hypothetical protein